MRKIFIILFAVLCESAVYAEKPGVSAAPVSDVAAVDPGEKVVSRQTVARAPGENLNFPAAVELPNSRKEVLAAYLHTDSVRRIMLRNLDSNGKPVGAAFNPNNWESKEFRSLSMYRLPRSTVRLKDDSKKHLRGSMLMFVGGNPLLVSSTASGGKVWTKFSPANGYGAHRISGFEAIEDGRIMAVFSDDGRFIFDRKDSMVIRKSVIYKIYSSDGGLTWGLPEIAVKHNICSLSDAVIMRSPKKTNELIMISSDRATATAFISVSADEGLTWSYPAKLPPGIRGDRFSAAVYRGNVYVAFRDMCRTLSDGTANPAFGDLVMWTGDFKDLTTGKKSGVKLLLADNFPTDREPDYDDLRIYDCGYPTVIPMSHNRICVIAYGRWKTEEAPYIENFIVDIKALKKWGKGVGK